MTRNPLTWMTRTLAFGFATSLVLASAAAAQVQYDLYHPEDYDNPANNEYAPNAVVGVGSLGNSSWQADMSQPNLSQNWLYFQGDGVTHPQLLFDPSEGLTLSDIASIAWDTNKDKAAASDNADLRDWFITIYTLDENYESPAGPWYNRRFQLRPWQYVDASGYNAGGWNTWYVGSNPGGGIQVNVEEYTQDGSDNGTYTLQQVQNNWGTDKLWFVALGTSFNNETGWAPGEFSSYVDNVYFDLGQDGGPVTLNLAAVPEPATAGLLGLGLGLIGLAAARRRRNA